MSELVKNINAWIASIITRLIDLTYLPFEGRFVSRITHRYFVCGVGNYIFLDALIYYIIYHYVVRGECVDIATFVVSPHVASLVMVFPITFFTGFWLNRYVAFNVTRPSIGMQIVRYGVTVAGSILLSYVALKFFVERFDVWATPAKMLSSVVTATYSYLMARFYTFREKNSQWRETRRR